MDTKFLNKLVDAGFGLHVGGEGVIVTSTSADTASGMEPQPSTRIKMPQTLSIRYYPNQSVKRTGVFPAKNPPRVKISNIHQKFDTLEEYRDFLYESYNEHLKAIQDFRKEKIENRLERNRELLQQQEEVNKTWQQPGRKVPYHIDNGTLNYPESGTYEADEDTKEKKNEQK